MTQLLMKADHRNHMYRCIGVYIHYVLLNAKMRELYYIT